MPGMEFPVSSNEDGQEVFRQARCEFVAIPGAVEVTALREWRNWQPIENDLQRESIELATRAAFKWEEDCSSATAVSSVAEITAAIGRNARAEASCMLVARTDWHGSYPLGVCLFHRTFAHNVFVDYIAVHPATKTNERGISGLATGMFCILCEIAVELNVQYLWGETTPRSAGWYRHLLQPEEAEPEALKNNLNDQLLVRIDVVADAARRLRQKW